MHALHLYFWNWLIARENVYGKIIFVVGLQLMIIFIVDQSDDYFINKLISCFVCKMSENGKKKKKLKKPKTKSSNVLFCPQRKDF